MICMHHYVLSVGSYHLSRGGSVRNCANTPVWQFQTTKESDRRMSEAIAPADPMDSDFPEGRELDKCSCQETSFSEDSREGRGCL